MSLGPLQYLVIGFEGNKFSGEIIPELNSLRERGIIRVVDLLFVQKDQQGNVSMREISDLSSDEARSLGPVVGDVQGLFTEEDIATIASDLPPQCSGAVLLFENVWATKLRDAIVRANGFLIDERPISQAALQEVSEELMGSHAQSQIQ